MFLLLFILFLVFRSSRALYQVFVPVYIYIYFAHCGRRNYFRFSFTLCVCFFREFFACFELCVLRTPSCFDLFVAQGGSFKGTTTTTTTAADVYRRSGDDLYVVL